MEGGAGTAVSHPRASRDRSGSTHFSFCVYKKLHNTKVSKLERIRVGSCSEGK